MLCVRKLRIAGIDTFRREREQEILVELQSFLFKHRQQHFVSRARISGRFENDQLAAAQTLCDLFAGREDVRDVGSFVLRSGVGTQMMIASHSLR